MKKRYTKAQRAEIVQILKYAKRHLWNGKDICPHNHSQYICLAASKRDKESLVEDLINERLGEATTVGGWLDKHNYVKLDRSYSHEQVQRYRHRWVNALIKEFSD